MATLGDVDGDGVAEVLVGMPTTGRVFVLSGAELGRGRAAPVHVVEAPENFAGAGFGLAISALNDVDGDGVADFAVGGETAERVWVVSGAAGRIVRRIGTPLPPLGIEAAFGSRLGTASNGDGVGICDLLVGAPGARGGDGEVFVFNAVSGDLRRSLRQPEEDRRSGAVPGFGLAVQSPGDADGDGVADYMISAPYFDAARGRVYVFSGRNGELISKIDSPDPAPGANFGFQDVAPGAPGDVDGDGRAELYVNGFRQSGPSGPDEGRGWVFDGHGGKALYSLAAPEPVSGGQFGWSMARTDHGGGGQADLYVGAAPHHRPGCDQDGGTWVFRGTDGVLLETLALPKEWSQVASAENWGPNLGWSIASPGDLDGDGVPDYVAGAPFTDVDGHQDQGLLVVFLSSG